jgi:hypothetical protein
MRILLDLYIFQFVDFMSYISRVIVFSLPSNDRQVFVFSRYGDDEIINSPTVVVYGQHDAQAVQDSPAQMTLRFLVYAHTEHVIYYVVHRLEVFLRRMRRVLHGTIQR